MALVKRGTISRPLVFSVFSLLGIAYANVDYFYHGGNQIAGRYIPAEGAASRDAVIVFVHGDGALNYDAHGYYEPIWDRLTQAGFAVFSWDKAGVGKSTGQWLHQSMDDRASEVQAAIDHLQANYGYEPQQIGLFGFSQAGWVAPRVASDHPAICFVVGFGFAMNWMEQSWYLTKTRMKLEGKTTADIALAHEAHQEEIEFLSRSPDYSDYLDRLSEDDSAMSQDRFQFVRLNFDADATQAFLTMRQPALVLLGEDDLNVDVQNTFNALEPVFAERPNSEVVIIEGATHGLLDSDGFNTQSPGILFLLRFLIYGESAFADGVLDRVTDWVSEAAQRCKPLS
ncbi:alpha/beta hydrolase family protein [Saccharospirillum alexandrii]|uniref:alpha/beta hydrolase family protein n=1 Tax=Saccharospirillum alexandrii TaxID=2448477 RepID=UPI000FDC602A|nr:alpha/beta fold hydrolase [Saccharospirillum alexandrii]